MTQFEIDCQQYRADKLSAFQQFHVARRISPLIPPLISAFREIARSGSLSSDSPALPAVLQSLADGFAQLSDESAEFVISTCLGVVRKQQGDSWVVIWNASAKRAAFDELNDLSKLLPIVLRVIQDNLAPFMSGLLTSQQPSTQDSAA